MLDSATSSAPIVLSVVAPCYNEQDGLAEFYRRTVAACENTVGHDFELVLVDDGSRDETWNQIAKLSSVDPRVVGVKLMRNHGHQLAATAGLTVARGQRVLLIDADLQDPPELVGKMMALMDDGADVVYGQRSKRQGETWFKKTTASFFYRILGRLTDVKIPVDTGDFRLMSRRVVDVLNAMPERNRFIRGLVSWIGGRQIALAYDRDARFAGVTKYPLKKMIRFAADAFTSFSIVPLRIATWVGVVSAAIAMALLVFTVVQWFRGDIVVGWSSTMAAITLFAAAQLIVLGIIGEYLGRLVQETKNRPMFLIDTITNAALPRPAKTDPLDRPAAASRPHLMSVPLRNGQMASGGE